VDEEAINEVPVRLTYLSNIKDEAGGISKPFTINGKNYQMVRAMTPTREKVNGVYCIDEVDEAGENIIHPIDYFEKTIAVRQEPTQIQEEATETKPSELQSPKLGEYKYFFVNKTTGKVRKFKTSEEVAKATMRDDETFMSLTEFKKFVQSAIFGSKKKEDLNEDQTPEELNKKAKVLMDMMSKKIPKSIIDTIKTNKLAQKEVILNFAEFIGVPANLLPELIGDMKNLVKQQQTQVATTTATDGGMKFEGRIITKDTIIKEALEQ
jgi:hypothetical protein